MLANAHAPTPKVDRNCQGLVSLSRAVLNRWSSLKALVSDNMHVNHEICDDQDPCSCVTD